MIWAVVLAAGESLRMGRQKLLLPFGDTTIAGAVVATAAAARVDGVLVVLGADREAIRSEIGSRAGDGHSVGSGRVAGGGRPAHSPRLVVPPDGAAGPDKRKPDIAFAVNDDYRLGMLTSIQAGLKALPEGARAAVIMLGDQPFLTARVVDAVVAAYEKGRPGLVIPTFQGRRGHPVLIDLKYKDEVLALDPLDGLRALVRAHADDILEVHTGDANILRDLDTPEDYAGLPKVN